MVDVNGAMAYLGIEAEYADQVQKNQVERALLAARSWLKGAVGNGVDMDDEKAEYLVLMAVGELYEVRSLSEAKTQKVLASLNRMAADFILQLKYGGAE